MKMIKWLCPLLLLVGMAVFAQTNVDVGLTNNPGGTNNVPGAETPSPLNLQGLLLLFIPPLVTVLVALIKKGLTFVPTWALPTIATALGELVNYVSGLAGGPSTSVTGGLLLGLSAVGLREVYAHTLTRVKKGKPELPTSVLPIGLLIGALLLPGTGCTTIPADQVALLIADARDIAEFGTRAALLENKEFRDELEATRDALKAVEELPDKITIDVLIGALSRLPLDQLQSEKGQLYVLGGKVIFRRITRSFELGDISDLRPFASALREGVEKGLGPAS